MLEQRRVTINIDLNLVGIALLMLCCHLVVVFLINPQLASQGLDYLQNLKHREDAIKIELPPRMAAMPKVRTLGKKNGSKDNNVLVTPKNETKYDKSKPIDPFKAAAAMNQPYRIPKEAKRQLPPPKQVAQAKPPVTGAKDPSLPQATSQSPTARPGSAKATVINQSALERLQRSSRPVQEVAQSNTQVAGQASIPNSPILSKSNINMQVEVPEGVAEDELNEYELMFYGFQKRMMEKYLGSIMLQVREYERKYPHKAVIPEGRHIMTGRVTFDSDGNIKQIKMVRWSQSENLQGLFEDVLKSMDSVPNPPKQLWNKQGDFVVFYNLTVNNT